MKSRYVSIAIILLFTVFMMMACGNRDKGPAELAIKAAEDAVNAAKKEAAKFVPDQVSTIESTLASAKDKLAKGQYKEALTEAQVIIGMAKEAALAAKAKKDEFTKTWAELSEGLPKMVEAVQNRVDTLSRATKLPAALTAEKFAEAKTGLAAVKEDWAKAQESFTAGNLANAVSVATSVKDKAVKAMEALGMPVPEAAKP
ncbi:MAG: hypothetical protein JW943_05990 [Deltaproteobacteria bacterium]|nr:hypothetical protein [Deltaproteobacteria bacterium]